MSVFVVRAFDQMREVLSGSKELALELKKLEAKLTDRLDLHESAIVDVLRRVQRREYGPSISKYQIAGFGVTRFRIINRWPW